MKSKEYYQEICKKINKINNECKHYYFIVETHYIENKAGELKEMHVSLRRMHKNKINQLLPASAEYIVLNFQTEEMARYQIGRIIGNHNKAQKMAVGETLSL
jgi:hypothetical protein